MEKQQITRVERVSLEHPDDETRVIEIEAAVTLPVDFTTLRDRVIVTWCKRHNWLFGTTVTQDFGELPADFQLQLLGAAASKAKSPHILRTTAV